MKILLINNLYPPYTRGGAERVVATIAEGLQGVGHRVFVVTTVPSWSMNIRAMLHGGWIREMVDGIPVYRIATANCFPYWAIGHHSAPVRFFWHIIDVFSFETSWLIKRIVRKEKPDIVMTHNLMGLGLTIPRALRSVGVRHIHTVHDVQLSVPSGLIFWGRQLPFAMMLFSSWYERLVRFLIGSPHVVVSPSQWLLDFYTDRGFFPKSKKVVLQNPISPIVIASEAKQSDTKCHPERAQRVEGSHPKTYGTPRQARGDNQWLSDRHGLRPRDDRGDIRFLYVGQLEKHKGILFLIEVIKKFQVSPHQNTFGTGQASFTFQLDIVGSGSLLPKIKKIAQWDRRLRIHGRVEPDAISQFYANADVVIVPSLVHENAPTVILEAFAHGVPVIASRVGGIPELVRDFETGWTFEAGNEKELLRILEQVVSEKKHAHIFGQNARRSIEAYTIDRYIQRFVKM